MERDDMKKNDQQSNSSEDLSPRGIENEPVSIQPSPNIQHQLMLQAPSTSQHTSQMRTSSYVAHPSLALGYPLHQTCTQQSGACNHPIKIQSGQGGNMNIFGSFTGNQTLYAAGGDITTNIYNNNSNINKQTNLSEDDCLWIQKLLLESAQKQCKSKGFQILIRQQIKICPLEITDRPSRKVYPAEGTSPHNSRKKARIMQCSEEDGHYNRNKDYEKIDFKHDSKVSVEQLFARADELANDLAQPEYANIVALIGQPGIGKTTLSKVITERALTRQLENVEEIKWVFYISVKNINFQNDTTFAEFLLKASLSTNAYNRLQARQISVIAFGHLLLDLENIFICMDGLDEASTDWACDYKPSFDMSQENKPLCYLYGLMMGDILPKAKKVFTSRQSHFVTINEHYRPLFVAEIMGLNTSSQEQLCVEICKEKGSEVWNVIKRNPNLSYSCYVPAKCIFIAFVIFENLKAGGDGLFYSLTHVFAAGFRHYFKHDLVREKGGNRANKIFLNKVAKLAWNGFSKLKIVFTNDDLLEVEIEPELLTNILATFVTEDNWNIKFMDSDVHRYFSHLIWQEYFAACYLVFFVGVGEFSKLLLKMKTNRWEVVAKFVFGLCNEKVGQVARDCFSNLIPQELAEKQRLLKNFIIKQLGKNLSGGKTVLQICPWMHEIDNEDFYADIVHLFPETLTLTGSILLTDVYSIGFVLGKSVKLFNIKISRTCMFHHGSFDALLTTINTLIKDVSICDKVTNQVLKSLAQHSPAIQGQLIIDSDQKDILESYLSQDFFNRFVSNFQPPCKLLSLVIRGIEMDDGCVSAMAMCINLTERLSLSNCKVSSAVIQNISSAIMKLEHEFTALTLDNNRIDDKGASAIALCLHMVQNLSMSGCNISSIGTSNIVTSLSQLPKQIQSLDISGNSISKATLQLLFNDKTSSMVKRLGLTKFNISENGIKAVGSFDLIMCLLMRRSESKNQMEIYVESAFEIDSIPNKLVIDCDFKACALSCVLHLFPPTLELVMKHVSDSAIQVVSSEIKQKIESLDISGNCISRSMLEDETVVYNCNKLYLDKFKISENGITHVGILDIFSHIVKSHLQPQEVFNTYIEVGFKVDCIPSRLVLDGDAQAYAFSFVMHLFPSTLELTIKGVGNAAITEVIKFATNKFQLLTFANYEFDDESAPTINLCLAATESLSFSSCKFSSCVLKSIAHAVSKLILPMKFLDVSESFITKSMLQLLLSEMDLGKLCKLYVTKFKVNEGKIESDGKLDLVLFLKSEQEPWELCKNIESAFEIDATPNKLAVDSDFEALASSFILNLFPPTTEITVKHVSNFAIQEIAQSVKVKLKRLDISESKISDSGAASLARCLHLFDQVCLGACNIEDRGVEILAEKIKDFDKPLQFLGLMSNYSLTDESARSLAACMHNIENLDARASGFTRAGKDLIASRSKGILWI